MGWVELGWVGLRKSVFLKKPLGTSKSFEKKVSTRKREQESVLKKEGSKHNIQEESISLQIRLENLDYFKGPGSFSV